jgi:cellulose biosynthesis protein BcsQ
MRTIVITNQKGGCGKTTTAVNLAAALAQVGQRVLIVDLDPQAHATLGLGYEPDAQARTIYHSLAHRQIPISKVVVSTRIKGLDLAPSNVLLAKAEQELTAISRKEYILVDHLRAVSDRYDICVIDCPPSLGLLTYNALVASTDVIVPVQTHYYALEGLKQLLDTVKTARKRFHPCSVKILGILLTFVESKAALSQQVEQQMRQFFGNLVFDTVIHRTLSLAEAPSAGQSISAYAPESKGAAEYRALAEEVIDPEYKKKRKLPKEVSAIVDEVQSAEDAGVLRPSVRPEAPKRIPPVTTEVPKQVPPVKTEAPEQIPTVAMEVPEQAPPVTTEIREQVPPVTTEIREQVPPVTTEAAGQVPQPVAAGGPGKRKFPFLSISAILLVVVVVTLMIVLNMTNTPPLASPDNIKVQEDTPTTIALMARDSDRDELTYYLVTRPSHGTLSEPGARMTYTPEPNYDGPDSFSFRVNDGTVDSNTATIELTVTAVNDAPEANHQSATTKVDRSVSIVLTGKDIDSEKWEFVICTQPGSGTLTFGSDFNANTGGNLVYTPKAGLTGTDSFTFKLDDGDAESAPAMVSINITPNHPPMAVPMTLTIVEDTPTAINLDGSDQDWDTVTYRVVTGPSHGSLSGTAPNLTYTPSANFSGLDSFTFKVNDSTTDSALASVSLKITPVNDPPTANASNVTMLEDMPAAVALAGIDPDGDSLSYSIAAQPSHGDLSGTEPNLTYTPHTNYYGSDSFTFTVSDGAVDSVPATMSLTITATDDPPTAIADSVTAQEDASASIVLAGDDPDGDPLTYSIVAQPSHGKLTGTAPNLTYTPDPNFSWLDSFTFKVHDGTTDSAAAAVMISVTQVNDPPEANDDKAVTQEDTPAEIDVLANDIEVDNELLKIIAVTDGKSGSVAVNPNGTLTYTPNENFYGTDAFTYTVSDREGEADKAEVNVAVSKVNDAPEFTSRPMTIAMVNVLYSYDVDAKDPDSEDTLIYSLAARPGGMMIDAVTGLIQWTPTRTDEKTVEVVVRVEDSNNTPVSDTQLFTISVNPTPPKMATLTVVDGYDQRSRRKLSADRKTDVVQASDNDRLETMSGSRTCYDFSDVTIPPGATIKSVVLYVEHFEEPQFTSGKLRWEVGTGWPGKKPTVWASTRAPVHKGEQNEAVGSWDITSFANTPGKLRQLQLQINNSDNASKKKALVDYIYAEVEWGWPAPKELAQSGELKLMRE